MKDYKIDFTAQVITVSAECAKRMNDPSSPEYAEIHKICSDFPSMKIKRRTHRTPASYTNQRGEKSCCNPYKNLTYERMEKFMDALPNGVEYRKQYDFLKDYASQVQANGYAIVRRWFEKQFQEYKSNPLFYLTEQPKVITAAEFQKNNAA